MSRACRPPARAGVDVEPAAGERGAGEHQRQHDGEPGELRDRVHAATAS